MHLATLLTTPSLHLAAAPPLVLGAWTAEPATVSEIRRVIAAQLRAAQQIGKAGMVGLVHEKTPLPGDEVRKVLAAELGKLSRYLIVDVTIIPQQGFRGAASRALISSLQLVVRPGYPQRVVSTYAEAAGQLFTELSKHHTGLTPLALQEVIDSFARQVWG